MEEKITMIEMLLEMFDYSVRPGEAEQFNIWVRRVSIALETAEMTEELSLWKKALNDSQYTDSSISFDPTFVLQTETMKAVLLGIYSRLKGKYDSEELIPLDIVKDTKDYLVTITKEANICFQMGLYDSAAVMIRRLIEQLIVDCFENNNLKSKIERPEGSYFGLDRLIDSFLKESWHIPKLLNKYLPELKHLKELGDNGAHGRNITNRKMIVKYEKALSFTLQGLVHLANYR